MLTFLHQKFRFLLIITLAIVGISFIFFGPEAGGGRPTSVMGATIDGRPVTPPEFNLMHRSVQILYTLQTGQLPDRSPRMEEIMAMQTWHRLVVLAEANRTGLRISPEAVNQYIRSHPFFTDQESGKFDPRALKQFEMVVLQPQGVSLERFQEIIRDQMLFETMLESAAGTAVVQPAEIDEVWRSLYGKADLSYVEVQLKDVLADIETGEDARRAYYEAHTATYQRPEHRSGSYVLFLDKNPPADEAARERAMRTLGEKAFQFSDPFYRAYEEGGAVPDFEQQAATQDLAVVRSEPVPESHPILPGDTEAALTRALFRLSEARPVSDYVKVPGGFAVIKLETVEAARPLPYEEVAAQVATDYRAHEEKRLLRDRGQEIHSALRTALQAGESWTAAAAALGLTAKEIPAFAPAGDDIQHPLAEEARYWAQQLRPGGVSQPVVETDRAAVFYLASRSDPEQEEAVILKDRVRQQLERQRSFQMQETWLQSRYATPGTSIPSFEHTLR